MTQLKKLHLATSLEELDKHTVLPDVRNKKIQMLVESARKLHKEAEKNYLECDEELAYVFYMKYFNLLSCIHKKPDYPQNKQMVRQMLGGHTINTETMDRLELLCKSLKRRYARLASSTVHKNMLSGQSTPPPISPNGKRQQREYDKLCPAERSDNRKATNESNARRSPNDTMSLISCEDLFKLTQENSVLIMDCRPSKDYDSSHLTYSWSVRVPEEHIAPGMSAGKLQDKLDSNSKIMWSARLVKYQVVLMDWNCRDVNAAYHSPIGILKDILLNWDPDVCYQTAIKILQGGYEYFMMMYPTLCTNPSVPAPQTTDLNIELDDIEYPSIHDITMKDDIENSWKVNRFFPPNTLGSTRPPSVDRTSKLAALKTYDQQTQKPIVEILKEQEVLLERAHMNDIELEQAAQKWQTIFEKKKNETKNDFVSSERELLYNLLQLESTAEDYKVENNRLRDELDTYKRLELVQQQRQPETLTLSLSEMDHLEETTKLIETKIQERQKLDEQHERERQQREQQLALALENKRHLKPPIIEDEEISRPKMPQFDRSVKPHTSVVPVSSRQPPTTTHHVDRHRDFSPVPGSMGPGLTGLKNLGNTCYMNSILQCMSNTQPLAEYCLSDKYKNYISRNNNTQGHIVEEVAALIKMLWNGNYKCVASKDLRNVIGQYQNIFRGTEQQDSHEFLTILMDWLHSDLQTLNVPERARDSVSTSERAWLEYTNAKESLILHLFYGQIKSTVKCVECNRESATYESFSNLSLELPTNALHLSQCMDMYFSGELIHGWNCPNCQRKRNAVKKLDISKLPPVLVVHLKRFFVDPDFIGNSFRKKQDFVHFPLENLDMTPYIAKSESRAVTPKTYQLYAVSNHYGSMESGHYTAFCKSGNNGRWFKFDDQIVTPLDKSNVVSSAAYILFYTWLPSIQLPGVN